MRIDFVSDVFIKNQNSFNQSNSNEDNKDVEKCRKTKIIASLKKKKRSSRVKKGVSIRKDFHGKS